jgi:hypothetical protein
MTVLLIIPIWVVMLLLVAGLCAAARRGDVAQEFAAQAGATAAGERIPTLVVAGVPAGEQQPGESAPVEIAA